MDDLKNFEKVNSLLDCYGILLTPYQKEIMILYYQENYSLREISELKNISRNAVFTLIKRVIKILDDYEEKLLLNYKKEKIISIINDEKLKEEILIILDEQGEN